MLNYATTKYGSITEEVIQRNDGKMQEEVNGVFGIIGDFCKASFGGRSFSKVHFKKMTKLALELIQETTFDSDVEEFLAELKK